MKIFNTEIKEAGHRIFKRDIGDLPSGTKIPVITHVFHSGKAGPVVALIGGLHGDEINGVEALRQLIVSERLEHLTKGSVIVIPLLNMYGFINFSREAVKGKDVNRSFPGSAKGSLASKVAQLVSTEIVMHSDLIIDLHTGGGARYNFPQVRYTKNDMASYEYARVFAPPVILDRNLIPGSLRSVAEKYAVPTLVYEAGESLRWCGYSIRVGKRGILRVLKHLDMIDIEVKPVGHEIIEFSKTKWLRAEDSGLYTWTKASGQWVVKGEPLGFIGDPSAEEYRRVYAAFDGFIIGHNNAAVVNAGDALFHIGMK